MEIPMYLEKRIGGMKMSVLVDAKGNLLKEGEVLSLDRGDIMYFFIANPNGSATLVACWSVGILKSVSIEEKMATLEKIKTVGLNERFIKEAEEIVELLKNAQVKDLEVVGPSLAEKVYLAMIEGCIAIF
jgi:hypothetical protein